MALVVLCGTPDMSVGGPETGVSTTSSSAGIVVAPAARGSLTQDLPDVAFNQQADEDDNPNARIVRTIVDIVWPDATLQSPILYESEQARPSHQPCASLPRAPPTTA
jgi:hypothetical protein